MPAHTVRVKNRFIESLKPSSASSVWFWNRAPFYAPTVIYRRSELADLFLLPSAIPAHTVRLKTRSVESLKRSSASSVWFWNRGAGTARMPSNTIIGNNRANPVPLKIPPDSGRIPAGVLNMLSDNRGSAGESSSHGTGTELGKGEDP
ncbi:hypothetical protein B0H13DRAFT_1850972 [Mycena leptocephala]|nr:hypothetical protein B0H13DRAFT_1850972 [Mycena leptocephala]